MLSCRMRIALMAAIVYYSVSFQRVAATVLYEDERIVTFDSTTGLSLNKIDWRFPFLGRIRNSLRISRDGFIIFDNDVVTSNVDVTVNVLRTTLTAGSGSYVWKRLTNDATTLSQVTRDIQPYFSVVGSYTFNAKWVLLVTWYKVTAPSSTSKNTFQLVLATDGVASFAMLNYETIAPSGLGTVKFGFTSPGTVLSIYSGQTGSNYNFLTTRTNVGVAGRWLVRVDGRGVLEPDCVGFTISLESGMHLRSPVSVGDVPSVCTTALSPSTAIATSFLLVPCNALPPILSPYCVSIVPVFAPNMFARHANSILALCFDDGQDLFKGDSSFIIHPNTVKNGFFALQSSNYPNNYVQFKSDTSNVKITVPDSSMAYNSSASFTLGILPNCPSANKATWCSTIDRSLCSQAPFDVLCRAKCDAPTDGFALAKYYSSYMVLQRAPARPRIWGYAANVGDTVQVAIVGRETVTATATLGQAGRPIWEAVFRPLEDGSGPFQIIATQVADNCNIVLDDVLVGDVWICSGQSNMKHRMIEIDNPDPDINDAVNYPNVRTFFNNLITSYTPLEDLDSVVRPWAIPTAANIRDFSAVCWLYGRNLWRELGRPVGMIETNWGGTRIEAWSSPDALDVCFAPGTVPPDGGPNAASALYNAMIHPFLPMPIYGVIWYQGESNAGNANVYGCAQKAMVNDWRQKWSGKSPEMDAVFPFGLVQAAPRRNQDIVFGFPDVRWAQTNGYGYTPNADYNRMFMAVAIDLPDYASPSGHDHPRYKRQIADRLTIAGLVVAYNKSDVGIYQGPIPFQVEFGTSTVRFKYKDALEIRQYQGWSGFELCCSSLATDPNCNNWVVTGIVGQGSFYVDVNNVCLGGGATPNVAGYRYLWRESPCALEACAIYSIENSLPAPPYRAFF